MLAWISTTGPCHEAAGVALTVQLGRCMCVPLQSGLTWDCLQAGGSPTYTLTEDFALGMEMCKLKWQCRYVQAYLALGEAPEQIRNCYQQRSRWCKVPLSSLLALQL